MSLESVASMADDWTADVPRRDLGGYEPVKGYRLQIRKHYRGTGDFKLLPALLVSSETAMPDRYHEILTIAPEDIPLWRTMLDRLEQF